MNELTTVEQQEMQRSSGVVMPVASPEEMHNAMVLYQRMKEAVLDPTDYQDAGRGQRFVKKSGWAKLAIAFGVSSEIIDERYERDEAGDLLRARFKVRAIAPNGRYAEGFGVCDIKEERFTHGKDHPKGWWKAGDPNNRDKIEHDLPSTAETRARNRAYSALFGHGEVSYEEVQLLGTDDDVTDAEVVTHVPQRDTPAGAGVGAAPPEPPVRPKPQTPYTQTTGGKDGTMGGIAAGQMNAIQNLAPKAGDAIPGNLAEWSYLEAAAYITALQERIAARKVSA